jgi:hypothetical protein
MAGFARRRSSLAGWLKAQVMLPVCDGWGCPAGMHSGVYESRATALLDVADL